MRTCGPTGLKSIYELFLILLSPYARTPFHAVSFDCIDTPLRPQQLLEHMIAMIRMFEIPFGFLPG